MNAPLPHIGTKRFRLWAIPALLGISLSVVAQDAPPPAAPPAPAPAPPPAAAPAPPPKSAGPDQKEVDAAIDRGCQWLLVEAAKGPSMIREGWGGGPHSRDAFILYTLVKGGADQSHPAFQSLLKRCLKGGKIERTYWAATLAMALQALDPERYQPVIRACAQYLVDAQCVNGQWAYSDKRWVSMPTVSAAPPPVKSGGGEGPPAVSPTTGTTALRRIPVTSRYRGPYDGDNSNTQYAVLGLRAAAAAGIDVPKGTWERARQWWNTDQHDDGGWKYAPGMKEHSYASMTEGGLGSLIICCNMLGESWALDEKTKKAFGWMEKHMKVTENMIGRHGEKNGFLYYHLYALERAGSLSATDRFGGSDWYPEGAKWLLRKQEKDGSWIGKVSDNAYEDRHNDTCFAILFLRRATRVLSGKEAGK